jgi:hypothetical protein
MTGGEEEERRELVIAQARRYKSALNKWEALSRLDPAAATRLWKEVKAAEEALFEALDALDGPRGA